MGDTKFRTRGPGSFGAVQLSVGAVLVLKLLVAPYGQLLASVDVSVPPLGAAKPARPLQKKGAKLRLCCPLQFSCCMKHLHLQKWIQSWLNDSMHRVAPWPRPGPCPNLDLMASKPASLDSARLNAALLSPPMRFTGSRLIHSIDRKLARKKRTPNSMSPWH